MIQSGKNHSQAERYRACCGELDGKRNPVKAATDRCDDGYIIAKQWRSESGGVHPVDKKLYRTVFERRLDFREIFRRHFESWYPVCAFSFDPQRFAARRQH